MEEQKLDQFSRMLVDFRKTNHLSQKDVALKLGVSRQWYVYLETGIKKPSIKIIKSLSELIGVDDVVLYALTRKWKRNILNKIFQAKQNG